MENNNLNSEQKKAVTHINGPLLIVAGAGTGKTSVLVSRLAYLIENKLAKPEEILITTFTEKAAGEMEERADKLLPYGYVDLWINTFHGFCERILRMHALDIGLPGSFKLLSTTEQWMLVRKNLHEFDLSYYRPLGNPTKFIHELLKHFSRLKDENISAQEYLGYAENLRQNQDLALAGSDKIPNSKFQIPNKVPNHKSPFTNHDSNDLESARIIELANAYHKYNQLMLDGGYLDFGDLITYTLKLFKERPNILKKYHDQFKFIMVDEFQDTNWAQYELVKMLAKPENNLVVVGDDDQSIYKFRGASLSNILQFKSDFPDAAEVVLAENYRSGQSILDTAYTFIKNNDPNRLEAKLGLDKKLKSNSSVPGEVNCLQFDTADEETSAAASLIKQIKEEEGWEWSDFAVLVRANDTAEKFINEFKAKNIPHEFVSLKGLYLRPIVLDILAYFRLLDNYHESSALFRVLNMEAFKISHSDIVALGKFARQKVWSLFETLKHKDIVAGIEPQAAARIDKLLNLLSKHSQLAQKENPSRLLVKIVYDSGLIEGLDQDRDIETFNILNQLLQKFKSLEASNADLRLRELMEILDMEMEAGESGNLPFSRSDAETVKVMTVHASKGLEFKCVILVDLVDKKFPTIARGEKISIPDALVREKTPEGDTHIEEERRLFYVAITRAKERLYLTGAKDYGGARDKKMSKFAAESGVACQEVKTGGKPKNGFVQELENMNRESIPEPVRYKLPEKFSFSQLESFANCPLQYKFNFLLKIPVEEKPTLQFGRLIHNCLREFFIPLVDPLPVQTGLFGNPSKEKADTPSKEQLLGIYAKHWSDSGYHSKEEQAKYKKKGREILETFYDGLVRDGWPQVAFLEKNFNFKLGKYMLKGAIDRIDRLPDGKLGVLDYKTGNPKDSLGYADKRQLLLYQLALESMGSKVGRLSYYYLENGQISAFEAKEKDLQKLKESIISQIEEIMQCKFDPKQGPLCAFCDFRKICEYKK